MLHKALFFSSARRSWRTGTEQLGAHACAQRPFFSLLRKASGHICFLRALRHIHAETSRTATHGAWQS